MSFTWQVAVLLTVIMTVCVQKCRTELPCKQGLFIFRNSTGLRGTQFEVCSKCDGEGEKIVAECTCVYDTKCGCDDGYVASNSTLGSRLNCQKAHKLKWVFFSTVTTTTTFLPVTMSLTAETPCRSSCRLHMLGAVPIFLAFLILAFVVSVLMGECVLFKTAGLKDQETRRGIMI